MLQKQGRGMNHEELMGRLDIWHKYMDEHFPHGHNWVNDQFSEVVNYINESHEVYLLLERFAHTMLDKSSRYGTYDPQALMLALDAMQIFFNGTPREDFFDAVRNDKKMSEEEKDYWLAMEKK